MTESTISIGRDSERLFAEYDPSMDFVPKVRQRDINIIHEVAPDLQGDIVTKTEVIPPSGNYTLVTVNSEVVGQGARKMHSPEYMATVRRRKSRQLANQIYDLQQNCDRDDLAVWTFPIIEAIKKLLATLGDAKQEGNTREILRQLRNTFLNGGWNKYKEVKSCRKVASIFDFLANAEEITPKDADSVFEKLSQAELNPVGPSTFLVDDESESPNVKEEVEVSG